MRRELPSSWVVLGVLAIATFAAGVVAQEQKPARPGSEARRKVPIRIQQLPARSVMVRRATGSYEQHPSLIQETLGQARRAGVNKPPQGSLIGIYPMDPDAVDSPKDLEWYLAVEAPPGTVKAKMPVSPGMLPTNLRADFGTLEAKFATVARPSGQDVYLMAALDPGLAITAEASYEAIPAVGLAMKEYMFRSGWVQVAPTRNVLIAGDPATPVDDKVQIVFPVRRRNVELPVSSLAVRERSATAGAAAPAGADMVEVQVQQLPRQPVVVRTVRGAAARSADLCSELIRVAAIPAAARPQARCSRIDLVDPDAAESPEKIEWRLAVEAPNAGSLRLGSPYRASSLPSSLAVTRETAADRAETERLAINAWIVRAGYVHSGPTRTEFQPGGSKVRLVIPVKPRSRQIPIEFVEAEEIRD
jgi:hypothetical protein